MINGNLKISVSEEDPTTEPSEPDPLLRLRIAILFRAIQDFFVKRSEIEKQAENSRPKHGIADYSEVKRWFYDRSDDAYPFSFFRICEAISDEPEFAMKKILEFLKDREIRSIYHTKVGRNNFTSLIAKHLAKKVGCDLQSIVLE